MSRFILIFSAFITIISAFLPICTKADIAPQPVSSTATPTPHPVLASVGYHSLPGKLIAKSKYVKLDDCTDADGSLSAVNISATDQATTCPPGYVAIQEVKTGVEKIDRTINSSHLRCCKATLEWTG